MSDRKTLARMGQELDQLESHLESYIRKMPSVEFEIMMSQIEAGLDEPNSVMSIIYSLAVVKATELSLRIQAKEGER